MRYLLNSLLLILFFQNTSLANTDYQTVFSFNSYNYSDPTSIDSFIHKFNGDYEKGDHAISYNQLSLGIEKNNWSFNFIKRIEYLYGFSDDTARFYRDIENDLILSETEQYQLNLTAEHFEATGLTIGYQWQVAPQLKIQLAASLLKASDFYDITLKGDATRQNFDEYQANAPTVIYSAHNELLEFPKSNGKGKGATLDIAIDWQINQQWQLALSIKDLASRIEWEDALLSNINRWQVHQLNDNGEFDTSPILEGRKLDYQQTLTKKWFSKLSYAMQDGAKIHAKTFHTRYFTHHNIAYEKPIDNKTAYSVAWHFQTSAIELGYIMPYGYIKVMTDSLSRTEAQAFGISSGFSVNF